MKQANHFFHVIEKQADFPACDLTEQNAAVLPHVLEKSGVEGYARHLENHQQYLYSLASQALEILGIRPITSIDTYSPQEYRSFTEGFATFEAFQMAVQQRQYNAQRAIEHTRAFYLANEEVADLEFSQRIGYWLEVRPNTEAALIKTGDLKGETLEQLRARTLGAQVAFELQRPLLDVA